MFPLDSLYSIFLFLIMISKHSIDAEVRDHSLNTERAVKRKLKMAFTDVEIKSGGQCIVAQRNHVKFRAVSSSLLDFYAQSHRIISPSLSMIERGC